jgi:hypothetical protein
MCKLLFIRKTELMRGDFLAEKAGHNFSPGNSSAQSTQAFDLILEHKGFAYLEPAVLPARLRGPLGLIFIPSTRMPHPVSDQRNELRRFSPQPEAKI